MAKETWYDKGYREAREGLPSDPPMDPGKRCYRDYVEGFADGELQVELYGDREDEGEDA